MQRGRPVLRGAQRLQRGPQLGERLGGDGRDLVERGGPVGRAALARTARGGGSPHVDGHQRVPDDVVQLVRERQPLGVETVLRRRLAGADGFIGERPLQCLAGPQRLPAQQRPEHQRHIRDEIDRAVSLAGEHHRDGDEQRHDGADKQRSGPAALKPDSEHQQHGDADRGPVRVRHGQARQQQRHLGGQDGERVAPAAHHRRAGQEGQDHDDRRQPGHLVQQQRVGEQRREGS